MVPTTPRDVYSVLNRTDRKKIVLNRTVERKTMSTYKETFDLFSLKSGLLDKAEQIDAIEDAALKAVSFERFWGHLKDVTKFLAGYYDQSFVGLVTTNHYNQGPPIVTSGKAQPHENEHRCCRPKNWGLGDNGMSKIAGKFVFGDFTEEDMEILTVEKSSAQAMLELFTQQWVYGMDSPMILQKDSSKWVKQKNLPGIVDRMNQMCASGLPPKKTKGKGEGAPVVHSGESMAAKAKRIRQMVGQDTAQPAAPVSPLAGFRA